MACEQNLFDRFGGVRPMAEVMLEPPSTVQSWKTNGRIPAAKQPAVLSKAEELGLNVHPIDIIFPLRVRSNLHPPVVTSGPLPADRATVKAGAPIAPCDRSTDMQASAAA